MWKPDFFVRFAVRFSRAEIFYFSGRFSMRKTISRIIITIAWLLTLYSCRPVVAAQVPDAVPVLPEVTQCEMREAG